MGTHITYTFLGVYIPHIYKYVYISAFMHPSFFMEPGRSSKIVLHLSYRACHLTWTVGSKLLGRHSIVLVGSHSNLLMLAWSLAPWYEPAHSVPCTYGVKMGSPPHGIVLGSKIPYKYLSFTTRVNWSLLTHDSSGAKHSSGKWLGMWHVRFEPKRFNKGPLHSHAPYSKSLEFISKLLNGCIPPSDS